MMKNIINGCGFPNTMMIIKIEKKIHYENIFSSEKDMIEELL